MAKPAGKLLGFDFDEWMKKSLKNGIMAVIDRWGDPNGYKKQEKKEELLKKAWAALSAFTPQPSRGDVEVLISSKTPDAQDPAPRTVPTSTKPTVLVVPITPVRPNTATGQGPSSAPIQPNTATGQRPSSGIQLSSPVVSSGVAKGKSPVPSSETSSNANSGTASTNATPKAFTLNQPHHDPQLEDGLALRAGNFHDQLTGLLLRYFHRVPQPSEGQEEEEIPPLRDIHELDDLSQLTLADVFDNEHDPCITSYRLKFLDFPARSYSPSAEPDRDYSCRGRGPVRSENSCALDTVIVAAKLLDIGHLQDDTGPRKWQDFAAQCKAFQQACLSMFREPWHILTQTESIRRRDEFYHQVIVESQAKRVAERLKPHGKIQKCVRVWDLCTDMAPQFCFDQFSRNVCTSCQQQLSLVPEPDISIVGKPTGDEVREIRFGELGTDWGKPPTMQQMLTRHFKPSEPSLDHMDCTGVGSESVAVQRIVGRSGPPCRLVVKPNHDYRNIPGATDDKITFTYSILKGKVKRSGEPWRDKGLYERTATYRWLGGIYRHDGQYRVFWQDSDYIVSNGNVKVYDGQLNHGAIIGDFPPCAPGFKVPEEWSSGTHLLFYERINDADRGLVMAEAQSVVAEVTLKGLSSKWKSGAPQTWPPSAAQIPAPQTPAAPKPVNTTKSVNSHSKKGMGKKGTGKVPVTTKTTGTGKVPAAAKTTGTGKVPAATKTTGTGKVPAATKTTGTGKVPGTVNVLGTTPGKSSTQTGVKRPPDPTTPVGQSGVKKRKIDTTIRLRSLDSS